MYGLSSKKRGLWVGLTLPEGRGTCPAGPSGSSACRPLLTFLGLLKGPGWDYAGLPLPHHGDLSLPQLRPARGLQVFREVAEPGMGHQVAEAFQAYLSFSQGGMPVLPGAKRLLAVIEVECIQGVCPYLPVIGVQHLLPAGGGADVIPGRENMTGVDAYPYRQVGTGMAHHIADFLKGDADHRALTCCGLYEQAQAGGCVKQVPHGEEAFCHPFQTALPVTLQGGPGVEIQVADAQGLAAEDLFPESGPAACQQIRVRGAKVHQIAGVAHDMREAQLLLFVQEGRYMGSRDGFGVPLALVCSKYLHRSSSYPATFQQTVFYASGDRGVGTQQARLGRGGGHEGNFTGKGNQKFALTPRQSIRDYIAGCLVRASFPPGILRLAGGQRIFFTITCVIPYPPPHAI